MGVLTTSSPNDLQEIAVLRQGDNRLRVYWKKQTKEVVLFFNDVELVQADGPIAATLSALLPTPLNVACCAVFESDGAPSLPMNEPNDLLLCDWSDFACDYLLVQATLN